jgi:hypothetical protein
MMMNREQDIDLVTPNKHTEFSFRLKRAVLVLDEVSYIRVVV